MSTEVVAKRPVALRILISVLLIGTGLKNLPAQDIYRSACRGNIQRVDSMLLETGINIRDNRGRSLLHWAVACKQKEVFRFLVDKGIEINGTDDKNRTALHVAVQYNNTTFFNYLIDLQSNNDWQKEFGGSLLETAVLDRSKTMVENLLETGIDINSKNERGSTALEISKRIGADDISQYLISRGADEKMVREPQPKGKYLGQEVPGMQSEMFSPNFISTEEDEFGSVFNKDGTEFYFGVDVGRRNEIRFSEMVDGQWTKPVTILTDDRYSYNDPFLSNDENRLYFISSRALDGKGAPKDIDLWYVDKTVEGWGEPINMGNTINTSGDEYYISFTNDEKMYFSSNGHHREDTARTDHDILYAKFEGGEFQEPISLPEAVNSKGYEADVFVSPDESYLIFCSTRDGGFGQGDLYVSFKDSKGNWSNANGLGIG